MASCMENGCSSGQQRPPEIFPKNKASFIDVCENEVEELNNVKYNLGFSMNRNEEAQRMEHYFNRMQPIILNENNIDT